MKRCISIPSGVGKAGQMGDYLRSGNLNRIPEKFRPNHIHFVSREEVQACDISRLLHDYGPDASASEIQLVQGKVLLLVEGYDDIPGEVFEIEAIRRYFRYATEVWPHWMYTGSTFTPNLMAIAFAALPEINVTRKDGTLQVSYDVASMMAFIQKSLPTAAWLHNRAGTAKHEGMCQMRAAAAYLGLEF